MIIINENNIWQDFFLRSSGYMMNKKYWVKSVIYKIEIKCVMTDNIKIIFPGDVVVLGK